MKAFAMDAYQGPLTLDETSKPIDRSATGRAHGRIAIRVARALAAG